MATDQKFLIDDFSQHVKLFSSKKTTDDRREIFTHTEKDYLDLHSEQ